VAVIRTRTVDLAANGEGATAYLAQPDDDSSHPGLVLIQEWWGIEAHVIDLAQKMAVEGFVTLVPDLYHGQVATEPDDAQKSLMMVMGNMERALTEIGGCLEYLKALGEVAPKKLGIIGFCMGGHLVYRAAERFSDIGAAVPFYGVMYDPTPEQLAPVQAPILAMYAEKDSYVPMEQIEKLRQTFAAAGKQYQAKVWPGDHGFVNNTHPDLGVYEEASAKPAMAEAVTFLRQNLR
jgi:carboxymethylenebutenolidase